MPRNGAHTETAYQLTGLNHERIASLIRELLSELGEDPDREGLLKTPERVAQAWDFITGGNRMSADALVNGAKFEVEHNNLIISRDIEIYSLCEHHLLPFFGRCHIGYIPGKQVLGLSKLARIVDLYARRLQIQERLTAQIADEIMRQIDAQGVGVVIEARHMCAMMRGVEKQNSVMTTSSVLGTFNDNDTTRSEFFSLLDRPVH